LGWQSDDAGTGWVKGEGLTPRTKLLLALPVIAALVIALVYFRLFSSPVVIAFIFVAYVAISLRNKRKFNRQQPK
jgi:Flp pilus assembly protein TadB